MRERVYEKIGDVELKVIWTDGELKRLDDIKSGRIQMEKKGRGPGRWFFPEQILEIRNSDKHGWELAEEHAVTKATISAIRTGKIYKHVGGQIRKVSEFSYDFSVAPIIERIYNYIHTFPGTTSRVIRNEFNLIKDRKYIKNLKRILMDLVEQDFIYIKSVRRQSVKTSTWRCYPVDAKRRYLNGKGDGSKVHV